VGLSVGVPFKHLSVDGDRTLDFRSLRSTLICYTNLN